MFLSPTSLTYLDQKSTWKSWLCTHLQVNRGKQVKSLTHVKSPLWVWGVTHEDTDLHRTSVTQPSSWLICSAGMAWEALLKVLPTMRHCPCPRELFSFQGKRQQGGKIMRKLSPRVIKQASAGKNAFLSPSTVAMLLLREMWWRHV